MKKTLFALLGICMLIGTSCKKDDNSSSGSNTSLNATEQKLIGTWYLKKERYISNVTSGSRTTTTDSTWTSFPNNPYVNFTSTKHTGAGSGYNTAGKVLTDKAFLSAGYSAGINGRTRGMTSTDQPWYFDGASNSLIATQYSYPYVQINGNSLIVAAPFTSLGVSGTDTLWFQK